MEKDLTKLLSLQSKAIGLNRWLCIYINIHEFEARKFIYGNIHINLLEVKLN